jgi:aminobenzoyl-glutamate utilization protein B
MARDGLFDDVDACLHWHPWSAAGVMNMRLAATNAIRIVFRGKTAHAGMEPWSGRSALDGLELAAHGINLMREHVEPTARIHYIVESGGEAPNVVPDYARLLLVVRDVDRAHVVATTEWVRQIAEGAALATQTSSEVDVFFGLHDLLPNAPLAERMQTHLERVGVPEWTEEEQAFARECQRNMELPELGLATDVLPLQPEVAIGGSSDVADVSWNAPTMGVVMPTVPLGVSMHTWPVTACGGMSIGLKGALAAAEVLTATAVDVLTDAELRAAARADFDRRIEGFEYVSPIPEGQEAPRGYRLPPTAP